MSSNFASKRRNAGPRKFFTKRYYGKRPIISHEFHPSFRLDNYDRSGMSNEWEYNGQSTNQEPDHGFLRASYSNFASSQPRSLEELQVERSYLINSLQREDAKATELLKKIRYLQDSCYDAAEGPMNRKLKKQLGHFKNRMCQCTKQEKSILARLGQVTFEIQSKERWSRIEYERLQQWNCHGFEQMRLDATCPEFAPHNTCSQQWSVQPVQPVHDGYYQGRYSQPMPGDGGFPESHRSTIHHELNILHELPCNMSSPVSSRLRSASMTNLTLPTEKAKRLSMPELAMGDSEGDAVNDNDPQYIGYYVCKLAQ